MKQAHQGLVFGLTAFAFENSTRFGLTAFAFENSYGMLETNVGNMHHGISTFQSGVMPGTPFKTPTPGTMPK
jgi:hypothetical protein